MSQQSSKWHPPPTIQTVTLSFSGELVLLVDSGVLLDGPNTFSAARKGDRNGSFQVFCCRELEVGMAGRRTAFVSEATAVSQGEMLMSLEAGVTGPPLVPHGELKQTLTREHITTYPSFSHSQNYVTIPLGRGIGHSVGCTVRSQYHYR